MPLTCTHNNIILKSIALGVNIEQKYYIWLSLLCHLTNGAYSHSRPLHLSVRHGDCAGSAVCVIRDEICRRLELDLVTLSIRRDSKRLFSNSVRARSPLPTPPVGQTCVHSSSSRHTATDYDFRNCVVPKSIRYNENTTNPSSSPTTTLSPPDRRRPTTTTVDYWTTQTKRFRDSTACSNPTRATSFAINR